MYVFQRFIRMNHDSTILITLFQAKWAVETRTEIATYLQQGSEGKFYFRMVDTVLTRDKNWVHWKAEACPPIERAPVSAEDFLNAKKGAEKACANKKLRATPMGSLDLRFLSDGENAGGLEKLKDPARYWNGGIVLKKAG